MQPTLEGNLLKKAVAFCVPQLARKLQRTPFSTAQTYFSIALLYQVLCVTHSRYSAWKHR
ncbi:MAG TPA: hypothetical protein V6D03_08910 [Candidatus Caenarcaniphilales bacterium]